MSSGLVWNNLVTYSLQIGLLVALASLVPVVLRLRLPGAKLVYWHVLLAACLLLPLVRPWRQEVITDNTSVTTTVLVVGQSGTPAARSIPKTEIALGLLLLGVAIRLGWLAAGFWRLRRYRRDSQPFRVALAWHSRAEFRIADQVASPVTFGARRPVVLLPRAFPSLDERQQTAILCHELLHVERHDWLFTVGEELVRAVFWFHPAIWWLLGEIQLAREQAVDREVIERTQAKDEYVDALLAIAGAHGEADLAPAPLFLRKRHLKQRVVSILKEVRMSRTRLVSALAAGLCILMAVCWFVASTFPLAAAPQVVNDAAGVSVDVGGATLLHRAPVGYPEAARNKGVQGVVVVQAKVDGSGNVTDAQVQSGPEELRRAALESVLQWHFAHEAAGNTRQLTIAFTLPKGAAPVAGPSSAVTVAPPPFPPGPSESTPRPTLTLKSIAVIGLSDEARTELLSRLPVHQGDTINSGQVSKISQAVRDFDEHLSVQLRPSSAGEATLTIMTPLNTARTAVKASESNVLPLKIGGNMQSTKLVSQARPTYPPDAKAARIQGVVQLSAIIAADGTIKNLEVLSGHPLLVPAALEAVKQWVYQPTLLNGNPVEVQTQIDVNFTLSQ
jgi:TonB family protein